jgi:hypothetical protein
MTPTVQRSLRRGVVIPAHPLALTAAKKLDERRQRALARYYAAAGAGGLAVGVHTTQFQIRDPAVGLYEPVLTIAAEEMDRADQARAAGDAAASGGNAADRPEPLVRIAGAVGPTRQAVAEAALARDRGYHAVLLSLAALKGATDDQLIAHCRAVGAVLPLVGFYLQPAVGGRPLSYAFWRRFAEIPAVVAVKIAPFNRYQSLDVVRAVADAGRDDVALYTGNDDNIVPDLLTTYPFGGRVASGSLGDAGGGREADGRAGRRIVGGLLGHWACWTRRAVELLADCHAAVAAGGAGATPGLLRRGVEVTDCNAAFFDAAGGFAGAIAGIHEVLRRQRLLDGDWCLDDRDRLSPGQREEIDRVHAAYPHLNDDAFVDAHRDEWMSG